MEADSWPIAICAMLLSHVLDLDSWQLGSLTWINLWFMNCILQTQCTFDSVRIWKLVRPPHSFHFLHIFKNLSFSAVGLLCVWFWILCEMKPNHMSCLKHQVKIRYNFIIYPKSDQAWKVWPVFVKIISSFPLWVQCLVSSNSDSWNTMKFI